MPLEIMYVVFASLAIVIAAACFFAGQLYRKRIAEAKIGSAEEEAVRLVNEAVKIAEAKKKETLIEAKEEILKSRSEAEKELRERRNEIQRMERRIVQKEETLDKRTTSFEKKEENLSLKIKEVENVQQEVNDIKRGHLAMLEKISGYTAEQAKNQLLEALEKDIQHDAASKIKEMEQRVRDESDARAREILSCVIQRYASDYVVEATVSVVPLPNDEMKGRIIGREGRNIRTLETHTGVDLIIDDTPEAITLSCFDPVRREIAKIALERLIADGRIHPARIEEMVEKARKEVEQSIKQEGERAVFEIGVHGLHTELIKLLGRLKYRTSYGQNVLVHSLEVAYISGLLASELGVDTTLAKRAGLLHDIGKALDHEIEGSHVDIGVETAKKYKENFDVIHAIAAHHSNIEAKTIYAFIIQAADAISAARPGARRENIEAYIKRLEKLEAIANDFPGVEKSFAIQAGREIRIAVKPEEVSDDEIVLMARDIVKRIEKDLEYPGQIKVHIVRENRAIEYAK